MSNSQYKHKRTEVGKSDEEVRTDQVSAARAFVAANLAAKSRAEQELEQREHVRRDRLKREMESQEANDAPGAEADNSTTASAQKKRKKKKPPSGLSFDAEDEEAA